MIAVERALARGSAGDWAPYEYAFELLNGTRAWHDTTRSTHSLHHMKCTDQAMLAS